MNERSERILAELGIKPRWLLREPAASTELTHREHPVELLEPVLSSAALGVSAPVPMAHAEPSLGALGNPGEQLGSEKQDPELARPALAWPELETMFSGEGDPEADCLFLLAPQAGMAGLSSVLTGPAGRLFDAMLASIGLKRGAGVYLACLPEPSAQGEACWANLIGLLGLMQPKVIVTLGDVRMPTELDLASVPRVSLGHPADLLREPGEKARAWVTLCRIQDLLTPQ